MLRSNLTPLCTFAIGHTLSWTSHFPMLHFLISAHSGEWNVFYSSFEETNSEQIQCETRSLWDYRQSWLLFLRGTKGGTRKDILVRMYKGSGIPIGHDVVISEHPAVSYTDPERSVTSQGLERGFSPPFPAAISIEALVPRLQLTEGFPLYSDGFYWYMEKTIQAHTSRQIILIEILIISCWILTFLN